MMTSKHSKKITLQESMEARLSKVEREKETLKHQVQDLKQKVIVLEADKKSLAQENSSLRRRRQQASTKHNHRHRYETRGPQSGKNVPSSSSSNENDSLHSLVPDDVPLSLGHSNTDNSHAPEDKAYYHAQPSFYAHYCHPPQYIHPSTHYQYGGVPPPFYNQASYYDNVAYHAFLGSNQEASGWADRDGERSYEDAQSQNTAPFGFGDTHY
jgi:regulator of replication initiation timing